MTSDQQDSTLAVSPMGEIERLSEVQPLAARVFDVLRELLASGKFQPGDRLNVVHLAQQMNVSRGPIREALQGLASEGLVDLIPRRGAFVPRLGADDLRELYEVRIALESAAAGLAARRRSESDIVTLRNCLNQTQAILKSGSAVPYPIDQDLHRQIVMAAHNTILMEHTVAVHRRVRLARALSGYDADRAVKAFEEHVAVIDAIAREDHIGATEAMRVHLGQSLDHVKSVL
jgi:DNA-binding GntR family transcriptional regulator